jgi:HSP20 family molecular chaperone IbpA
MFTSISGDIRHFRNDIYRVFRDLSKDVFDQFSVPDACKISNYPPVNIIQNGDDYTIELAVAGFKHDELKMIKTPGDPTVLCVSGKKEKDEDAEKQEYVIQRLAARPFTLKFPLPQHYEIREGSVRLENGILTIVVEKNLPEDLRPQEVKIN